MAQWVPFSPLPSWEHRFAMTERVIIGRRGVGRLTDECEALGMSRVVLVTGQTLYNHTPLIAAIERLLGARHVATFSRMREHVPASARDELARLLETTSANGVISVGGGSSIDGAKAAIAQHDNGATPHIALSTTLSAAEFTETAGVTDDVTRRKSRVASPQLAPRVVILDPEVSTYTPELLWLSTGIRALDHAVETVYAPQADRFAILLALEAIQRLRQFLPMSRKHPDDLDVRQELQVAAWYSALGLPGVTVAPSHPLGRDLGATFGIGHGITSCILLPPSINFMAEAESKRVEPLTEAFEVHNVNQIGAACQAFIQSLGLPGSLRAVGFNEHALEQFISMVPAKWATIVRAAF